MSISVREYTPDDIAAMRDIWNEVVLQKNAFPQIEPLGDDAADFFYSQSFCGVAEENGELLGMYADISAMRAMP